MITTEPLPRRTIGECWYCGATLEESYFGDRYWVGGDTSCNHICTEKWLEQQCETFTTETSQNMHVVRK